MSVFYSPRLSVFFGKYRSLAVQKQERLYNFYIALLFKSVICFHKKLGLVYAPFLIGKQMTYQIVFIINMIINGALPCHLKVLLFMLHRTCSMVSALSF